MGSKFGRLKGFREILSWKNTCDLAFPLGLSFTVEFFHDLQGKLQPPYQIDVVPTGRESYGLLFFFWYFLLNVRLIGQSFGKTVLHCIAKSALSLSLSLFLSAMISGKEKQTTPFSTFLRVPCNDVPGPWLVMTLPSTTALAS